MTSEDYMLEAMIEEYNNNAKMAVTVGKDSPYYIIYKWCAERLNRIIMWSAGDSLETVDSEIELPTGTVTYKRIKYKE